MRFATDFGRGPTRYLDTIATIFLVRASMINTWPCNSA
jgi:hypothetical protein